MQTVKVDVAIVGGGGAGLRAAIAAAERYPDASIALISKVYPMRSHTVAAEGGSAGVVGEGDSLEKHFNDTVAGGDWLSDQDVVEYFVNHATEEMYQLEKWGIPWSRRTDGRPNVRRFGGMSQPRTWFAADKTGFYMLHSMFQTSLKYPQIVRYDEFFGLEVVTAGEGDNRRVHGVLAYTMRDGYPVLFEAPSVVITTGGAGRIYGSNTNGAICTADGMGMAYRAGVPLRDMEFVQYHPTALPGSGVLLTEGARGEGGILVNRDGYRYLQDYGLGPETPLGKPENKFMELGPRDRVSQAYWHELQKGRTIDTAHGPAVGLDLRHLGKDYIHERLPLIVDSPSSTSGSTRWSTSSRSGPRCTTRWVVSGSTSARPPRCPGCSPRGSAPPPACTAPTGWGPTPSPSCACWARWPGSRRRRSRCSSRSDRQRPCGPRRRRSPTATWR